VGGVESGLVAFALDHDAIFEDVDVDMMGHHRGLDSSWAAVYGLQVPVSYVQHPRRS
jgi:hypothetical protein